jgi:hypothetical protein
MIGEQKTFMIFIMSESGKYEELGRRTIHVVQGYGAMVFQMD